MVDLGLGIGYRDELAAPILRRSDLGFVEVVAESLPRHREVPLPLQEARRRGVAVVPHGLRLSLGGAERPDGERLAALASLAERVKAPLVSEHVAFVRAGGREVGHLLPVPRTREALGVLVENVREAMAELPVPLALEPIASLVAWPGAELDEGAFLTELLERTGALLLLDVANLYANARNDGGDAAALLDRIPLERVAYVHVAGGVECGGLYHDTHAHPVPGVVLDLLAQLAQRRPPPGAMLERDHHHPPVDELYAELDAIAKAARLACPAAGAGGGRRCPGAQPIRPPLPPLVKPEADAAGARHRLGTEQQALAVAVLDDGQAPPGFDAGRLTAAAAAVARKRAREGTAAQPVEDQQPLRSGTRAGRSRLHRAGPAGRWVLDARRVRRLRYSPTASSTSHSTRGASFQRRSRS